MVKYAVLLGFFVLTGCASKVGEYAPKSKVEGAAFASADLSITPEAVRKNFEEYRGTNVAWAGIIREVDYKETERTIQVAFLVDQHDFDWKLHKGDQPFKLESERGGPFAAGWEVKKPTRASLLRKQAGPGDMLIAYGQPVKVRAGVIQLKTDQIRAVKIDEVQFTDPETAPPNVLDVPMNAVESE